MKDLTRERPEILAAAERKMHAWAMNEQLADRADRFRVSEKRTQRAVKFVTISRETGAGGSEIGAALAKRLGWQFFDRNLLDCMAEQFHLPRMMLDLVDETHCSWVYDVLGTWMDRKIVPHEKFVTCLSRVISNAARQGNSVFIGRCAQFLLPRKEILAVRLIASPEYRIQRVMARSGVGRSDARQQIAELDGGRREFAERFFHHDITDPHLYDMVINVERCGVEKTVDEIVAAVEASAVG